MFFLIGFLKLAANEALMVSDPCYFKYGEGRAIQRGAGFAGTGETS